MMFGNLEIILPTHEESLPFNLPPIENSDKNKYILPANRLPIKIEEQVNRDRVPLKEPFQQIIEYQLGKLESTVELLKEIYGKNGFEFQLEDTEDGLFISVSLNGISTKELGKQNYMQQMGNFKKLSNQLQDPHHIVKAGAPAIDFLQHLESIEDPHCFIKMVLLKDSRLHKFLHSLRSDIYEWINYMIAQQHIRLLYSNKEKLPALFKKYGVRGNPEQIISAIKTAQRQINEVTGIIPGEIIIQDVKKSDVIAEA